MSGWKLAWYLLLTSLGCVIGIRLINTTCEQIQFDVNVPEEIVLNTRGGTTLAITVTTLPERTHFTVLHYTAYSRNELSFHQIAVGGRVTHESGIQVFRGNNTTWMMVFLSSKPKFSGFYEIRIGDCYTTENLTAASMVLRYSGDDFNLTAPDIAIPSLKLYCPYISSYFLLKVFHQGTVIKQTDVFFDSPREDLFFLPINTTTNLTTEKYQCNAQNSPSFDEIDYYISISPIQNTFNLSLRVREDDNIQINLTNLCLPFSSKFVTSSDLTGITTSTALDPPLVTFSHDDVLLTDYNLTVAELSHNGQYSCLVTHILYEAQIQILDLYVKPLNVCAHSNGGCEHLCSTDIIADTFNCSCRPGYELTPDLFGCEDVNECLSNLLHDCVIPSQRCRNEPVGSYSCECADGYLLELSSGECQDVDECETQDGGCLHLCVNSQGSYSCQCKFGYTLLSIDNKTCIDLTSVEIENPPSLLTPIILASVFGVIFLLSIFTIVLLLIAVCKHTRAPTRLKYDMFAKRMSGDFKCHQQIANPAFRLDQSSLFGKRISPKKRASYGILEDNDFHLESHDIAVKRPLSLEQAALSEGTITELDYFPDDVILPKLLTTNPSPSTLPKYEPSRRPTDDSPESKRKYLPHSNMVPVLPSIGDNFQLRSVKTSSRHSGQDTYSQISNDIQIDQTFC
ncbi:Fibrillin-1-like isoform X33 [Oopsacas minuta]|uniref:Fibrillin-1-like isoform X33 n=1 Tax=Oopsacas minuta TaxID=111878 RepID=A0AAV7KKW6_9METZ|nr:Fibrillin-1-like isoform X33 [Oopsacas minuta]